MNYYAPIPLTTLTVFNSVNYITTETTIPPQIGELYISNSVTTMSLAVQNTSYQWSVGWATNTSSNNGTMTINATTGSIVPHLSGYYCSLATISFFSTSNDTFLFSLYKNNAMLTGHAQEQQVKVNPNIYTLSINGIDSFTNGDVLTMRVKCTTSANVAIGICYANWSVFRIT